MKLLTESVDVVLHQAHEKNIDIEVQKETYSVYGDRGKLKQVILNLLTNAIKYNRNNGHIYVKTEAATHNDAPFVRLMVQDTGFGISPENVKNLFQKFFRVADTAGYTQGTGLGLNITKHIVEAHGGHIWVESEQGVGSTFFVLLPLEEEETT